MVFRINQSNTAFQFNKPGTASGSIYQQNFFNQGSIFTQGGFGDFFSRGCRNERHGGGVGRTPKPVKPPVPPPSGDPSTPPPPPPPPPPPSA